MAVQRIRVYPTSDVHLLMNHGTPVQLTVYELGDGLRLSNDLTAHDKTEFLEFDPDIVDGTKAKRGLFDPVARGTTVGRIRHTDTSGSTEIVSEVLVRVMVHDAIDEFWIGNNRATIQEGESNYVLTVYARFTDGMIGDISSHPYLEFYPDDPNTNIISIDKEGRLKGETYSPGPVVINVEHNGVKQSINAFVSERVHNRPILKRVHRSGKFTEKRNILFLAEGFQKSQEPLFDYVVTAIYERVFNTDSYAPFNLLKDSFNIWKAFEPSPEAGVTIGNPVAANGVPVPYSSVKLTCDPSDSYKLKQLISIVGLPVFGGPINLTSARAQWSEKYPDDFDPSRLDQVAFDDWKQQISFGYLQARDSRYGFQIGSRFGDRLSTTTEQPLNTWYLPSGSTRRVLPDRRRTNAHWDHFGPFFNYLTSLRYTRNPDHPDPNDPDPNDPDYVDSRVWGLSGKDRGFVFVVVNDEYRGGTNHVQVALTIGNARKHAVVPNGKKLDHSPDFKKRDINISLLSHVWVHEFAHSLNLHEEYEAYDDPATGTLQENSPGIKGIESRKNVTHLYEIRHGTGTHIDVKKIKWNWHRTKDAAVTATASTSPSPNNILVNLKAGEGDRWKEYQATNTKVFLRHPNMSREIGPLTVINVDVANDVVTLSGGQINNPKPVFRTLQTE